MHLGAGRVRLGVGGPARRIRVCCRDKQVATRCAGEADRSQLSGSEEQRCLLKIRMAHAEDADSLADFLRKLNHFHRLEGQPAESVRAQVRADLQPLPGRSRATRSTWQQDADEQILGYANVHWLPYLFLPGPEGYVSELFVAEAARGQGIGTRLLEAVKGEAATRNCSRLSLLNMRDRESYQRAFYAKDGWHGTERRGQFHLRAEVDLTGRST